MRGLRPTSSPGGPSVYSSRSMPKLWRWRHGRDGGLGDQVAFFAELVTGRSPSPAWRDQIVAAVTRSRAAQPEAARRAITLILASPLAQLA